MNRETRSAIYIHLILFSLLSAIAETFVMFFHCFIISNQSIAQNT